MVRRGKSSQRWLQEHHADPFVHKARAAGWRSRAVFKLEEIDRRERLLHPGGTVIDLGAAPGAWSQYAARRVGPRGRVIALDLLPIDAIAGVEVIQGDFREEVVLAELRGSLGDRAVDVLLSDLAPNLAGIDAIDQPRAAYLVELALDLAGEVLKPEGHALIKVFQGAGFQELLARARAEFRRVRLLKPAASRARSPETYLLATGRRLV